MMSNQIITNINQDMISDKWQHLKVGHDSSTFKDLALTWFDRLPKTTAHFSLAWFQTNAYDNKWCQTKLFTNIDQDIILTNDVKSNYLQISTKTSF